MSISIVQSRLDMYNCKTAMEEENAVREIAQEIVLSALSRAGFFKFAAFQGGTCLRIIYGMERFSEDLDFAVIKQDKNFNLEKYVEVVCGELRQYGFEFEQNVKKSPDKTVKKGFIKDSTIVKMLIFKHFRAGKDTRNISIKIEVDTNPPGGAELEVKYLDYPYAFEILSYNMPSLFAGKSHALLCREYVKGRDWYDFAWYISRKSQINYNLLSAALEQQGSWKGQNVKVDKEWFMKALKVKISEIDWKKAADDVKRFLKPHEIQSLEVWGVDFFNSRIEKMEQYLL
jgi:predicted nucleotidyltransferase component of viral defense system